MNTDKLVMRMLAIAFGLVNVPHRWTKDKWGALNARDESCDNPRDPSIRRRCLGFAVDTALARQKLPGELRQQVEERMVAIVADAIRARSKVHWARGRHFDKFERDSATITMWNDARQRQHRHIVSLGEAVLKAA